MSGTPEVRNALKAVVVYVILVLVFTLISLVSAPPPSQVGTFRAIQTIPAHEAELAAFGVLLAFLPSLTARRLNYGMVLLIPAVVILTDLDHVPSMVGLLQPIRPAHSFVFLMTSVLLVLVTVRRGDFGAAIASGFFAHLSVDTGVFPPFSPFSFTYYGLVSYRVYFVTGAIIFALFAGYLDGRRRKGDSRGSLEHRDTATAGQPQRIMPSARSESRARELLTL